MARQKGKGIGESVYTLVSIYLHTASGSEHGRHYIAAWEKAELALECQLVYSVMSPPKKIGPVYV